jgi:hypothetical protein
MSSETFNEMLYGESGSLAEWRKRFVSDDQLNRITGEFTRLKSESQKRLAEIDTTLEQLGDRLERLGRSLQRPNPSIQNEELSRLLHFGPASGVTVNGIIDFLAHHRKV